jgi:hypothetical protein
MTMDSNWKVILLLSALSESVCIEKVAFCCYENRGVLGIASVLFFLY